MNDIIMEKVMQLNETQFRLFAKNGKTKEIKSILGIPEKEKYAIGDSMVKVNKVTLPNDVLKATWQGKDRYYVVINPIDEVMAFCYSVYPM